MAPAAAYLAGEPACRGQVIFSAGPELSLIAPPRLIEAVRTADTADFAASLDTLMPVVLGLAEERQRSTGGSNPRFGPVFDQPGTTRPPAPAALPGRAGRGAAGRLRQLAERQPAAAGPDRRVLDRPGDRRTRRPSARGAARRAPAMVRRRRPAARRGDVRPSGVDRRP